MRELALETRLVGKAAQTAVFMSPGALSEPGRERRREAKALDRGGDEQRMSAPRAALGARNLNRAGAGQAAGILVLSLA
jgi:hypothetical protein